MQMSPCWVYHFAFYSKKIGCQKNGVKQPLMVSFLEIKGEVSIFFCYGFLNVCHLVRRNEQKVLPAESQRILISGSVVTFFEHS